MASASETKWQIGRHTLLERNKYMFNNSLMSDVKFSFPNKQTIPAHKYVLTISSPVFFAMFYGGLADQGETIDITDCDSDIFRQFLRYLYCDDVNFRDVNNAIQVWHLADKYDLPSLASECVNFVEAVMEPLNAFRVLPYARRFNHEGLEMVCWETIDYNAQEIVAHESFVDLKYEYLLPFLQRSSLRVQGESLFKAVDRWAAKRCEESNMTVEGANKRSVLGEDLLKHIRFSLMSPTVFSKVVMPKEILHTTEVIDVFKQFTSVPIPGGLKFSILPRAGLKQNTGFSSLDLGNINTSSSNKPDADIESTQKSGVLTFLVKGAIELYGVTVIARPPCCVSVSVFGRDKKILSQVKKKILTAREDSRRIARNRSNANVSACFDVFFNRPFCLSKNTCYTIETQTQTDIPALQSRNFFVWSKSSQTWIQREPAILNCSGHYTEWIPANIHYKGEVLALLYRQDKKSGATHA